MKFSPYKSGKRIAEQDEGDSEDEYYYDSEDSEDLEYPVHSVQTPSTARIWLEYNKETQYAIKEAIDAKKESSRGLAYKSTAEVSIQSGIDSLASEVDELTRLLRATEVEEAAEDDRRKAELEASNTGLLDSVAATIREFEAEEKLRQERERIKAQEEADRRKKEAEDKEKAQAAQAAQAKADVLKKTQAEAQAKAQAEATRTDLARTEAKEAEVKATEAAQKEAQVAIQRAAEAEKKGKQASETKNEEEDKIVEADSPRGESLKWRQELDDFKLKVLKPVSENKDMKNFCHRARLRLNARVGQVTRSIGVIKEVSTGIKSIFDEARTKDDDELVLRWCKNSFCKAVVSQAETEVMVNPTAAYPLAFLVVTLLASHPDLIQLYLMRLAKKCPWTVPFVDFDKALESGRKALGYRRKGDGPWEAETAYMERQTGIFRLWAATVSLDVKANPYPISNGWKLVARLLNQQYKDKDMINICYNIIATFLEIAGKTFTKAYGHQSMKMIRAIALWVGPDAGGGNATRLRILVEDFVLHGKTGIDFAFEG